MDADDAIDFRERVFEIISSVPAGSVITYGDVAALAGHPYAARVVGTIAHYGDPSLPWQRLVNRFGGLATGFYGGRQAQADMLLEEGVICNNFIVSNFENIRWQPYER